MEKYIKQIIIGAIGHSLACIIYGLDKIITRAIGIDSWQQLFLSVIYSFAAWFILGWVFQKIANKMTKS